MFGIFSVFTQYPFRNREHWACARILPGFLLMHTRTPYIRFCLGLINKALVFLLVLPLSLSAFAEDTEPIESAAEIEYPPFSILDEEGRADGFAVDLLRVALQKMGREVDFRVGPWKEVRGWLEQGEIDALPLVGAHPSASPCSILRSRI